MMSTLRWSAVADKRPLEATPSIQYNNLSVTRTKSEQQQQQLLGFAHQNQVHVMSHPSGKSISSTVSGLVTSVTWIDAGPVLGDVLVVCTTVSVEFFSRSSCSTTTTTFVPFHVHSPLDQIPATSRTTFSRGGARGATAIYSSLLSSSSSSSVLILVGTCTGTVLSFTLSPSTKSSPTSTTVVVTPTITSSPEKLQTPCSAITCVCSSPSGGKPVPFAGCALDGPAGSSTGGGASWACSDDAGTVVVFGRSSSSSSHSRAWCRCALLAACGSPCTGVAFHPTCAALIASFASGHVRVFSLDSHSVSVEICAHARPITALHVHPVLPLAVTTSEDAWIRCWSLVASPPVSNPQPQQHPTSITVRQAFAASLPSPAMWTGAQFIDVVSSSSSSSTKTTKTTVSISVVAFDVPSLYVFNQT